MKTRVHLYSGLQAYVNNQDFIEVSGDTILECLNDLVEKFPALNKVLFDKAGKLIPGIMISINLQSPTGETLEKSINPGDEIYVIMMIAGG